VFSISTEPSQKLLRVKLTGFFTVEAVAAFARAAQKAVGEMGCASGEYLHLCDVSDLSLQSQNVVPAFERFINSPERRSHKLAIVTGHAAIRMQIRRLLRRSDAAVFTSVADAEQWLALRQIRPSDCSPQMPLAPSFLTFAGI
jgi:hypothetical protein